MTTGATDSHSFKSWSYVCHWSLAILTSLSNITKKKGVFFRFLSAYTYFFFIIGCHCYISNVFTALSFCLFHFSPCIFPCLVLLALGVLIYAFSLTVTSFAMLRWTHKHLNILSTHHCKIFLPTFLPSIISFLTSFLPSFLPYFLISLGWTRWLLAAYLIQHFFRPFSHTLTSPLSPSPLPIPPFLNLIPAVCLPSFSLSSCPSCSLPDSRHLNKTQSLVWQAPPHHPERREREGWRE